MTGISTRITSSMCLAGTSLSKQRTVINTDCRPRSIAIMLKRTIMKGANVGDRTAIIVGQKHYSYNDLMSSSLELSRILLRSHINSDAVGGSQGYLDGVRVGIDANPSAEFVAALIATWLCGRIAVPLARNYPETELLHVMNDSEISLVLSTADCTDSVRNVTLKSNAQLCIIPPVLNMSSKMNLCGHTHQESFFRCDDQPALIVYTSGTSGKPKGVLHTNRGIISQVQMLVEAWEYCSDDKFLHCLPLHHVHGLFNALLAPLYVGASVEFLPKFSVRGIWQIWRESYPSNDKIADDAITVFTGVPTMYARLIQGYEAMDPDLQADSASAARNLRLMVKIIDDNEKDDKKMGELCVRSPSMFKEYWKLPQTTKDAFTVDGFFKTGDACTIDEDGYYVILGRKSADILKVGGYKVSALEIESVLLQHPVIAECCVLGLEDKDYGDVVCAIIVPERDEPCHSLGLDELQKWAEDKLAPHKIPTRLYVWDILPRNAMGKVSKNELKKMLSTQT